MARRVKIKIIPSVSESNLLTVEEAMRQVLDCIAIISAADSSIDKDKQDSIVWKLYDISKNSPFTLTAEAYGKDPSVNMDIKAGRVLSVFNTAIDAVLNDKDIPEWVGKSAKNPLQTLLKRNLNGIGRTEIDLGEDMPLISISHRTATQGITNLQKLEQPVYDHTHTAFGSLEGQIINAGTYYSKPSFTIRERLTKKDVRCVVKNEAIEKIGAEHNLQEVWGNKRVIVKGAISYDAKGNIIFIDAIDIRAIEIKEILPNQLFDPNFTEGINVSEHLDNIREGKHE